MVSAVHHYSTHVGFRLMNSNCQHIFTVTYSIWILKSQIFLCREKAHELSCTDAVKYKVWQTVSSYELDVHFIEHVTVEHMAVIEEPRPNFFLCLISVFKSSAYLWAMKFRSASVFVVTPNYVLLWRLCVVQCGYDCVRARVYLRINTLRPFTHSASVYTFWVYSLQFW